MTCHKSTIRYDVAGDSIGNMASDGVWTYNWTHGRQLSSMTSMPPVIITQQPEDYTGAVGDTATFTVSATGDGLTYQWQYSTDGGTIWSDSSNTGNTTNTLSIPFLAHRVGQLYRCVVTDEIGHSVKSQPGQLILASGVSVMSTNAQTLQITDQPDDYYGTDGDTATFKVTATGSGLTYKWEYSDTDGLYWWDSSAQGAATDTLRIAYASGRVGYLYRCIITDAGGNTVTSRPAEIKAAIYDTWDFTYGADGLRKSMYNGTILYTYYYIDGRLSQMKVGGRTLRFTYDESGKPLYMTYMGTPYYYVTNLQGDVTEILDAGGNVVAYYIYDAWGKLLSFGGPLSATVGEHNPLRYRGYVYDVETGLYYLQSRYYDPEMGRFISADSYASTGQGILGNNMFAYCNNNPVIFVDSLGREPTESIDTDGDGEPDCYVYEYTYTYVVKYQMATVSWTVTGSVYIYTGRTTTDMETIESPDGFDARTDILVADLTNNSNATMYGYQAQKVDSVYRMSIIKCLRQYDLDFNTPWERSESSLLTEWNSHQVFAIFDKSAQDIDFDNDEEGWTFGDYCNKAVKRVIDKFIGKK